MPAIKRRAIANLNNKVSARFRRLRVAKIAVMLAAFELRRDLRIAAATGKFAKIDDLFSNVCQGRLA